MYISYFLIISHWKREWSFIWKINWIPFTQGCFVSSLVEIGLVIFEKKIFFRQCIFVVSWLYFLGKWHDPSFEQIESPFLQGCFVPSLVEIVYRQTDGRRSTGDQTRGPQAWTVTWVSETALTSCQIGSKDQCLLDRVKKSENSKCC